MRQLREREKAYLKFTVGRLLPLAAFTVTVAVAHHLHRIPFLKFHTNENIRKLSLYSQRMHYNLRLPSQPPQHNAPVTSQLEYEQSARPLLA